jgi:hypothetical protein
MIMVTHNGNKLMKMYLYFTTKEYYVAWIKKYRQYEMKHDLHFNEKSLFW